VRLLLTPIVIAITAVGCTSLTPSEDPVNLKLTDLEARVLRIEKVVENQSLIQLASELEQLRAETTQLRGQIETLRFETENSDGRQRDLYVDVDRRLQSLEQSQRVGFAPPPVSAPPTSGSSQSASSQAPAVAAAPPRPVGSDQQNYQAAFDLIQARKYPEAGTAFAKFLSDFPTSPLADNAQYWLAETRYVQRQFQSALPEFQKVVDNYPQSAKLPDALLKVGYCHIELGNREAARTALQQVMRQYPDTTAARLATQRLDRLSQEGG
jgi:tol-pal system protein YbgF